MKPTILLSPARSIALLAGAKTATAQAYYNQRPYVYAQENAEQAWERTADQAQCPIGFRCRDLGENSERSGDQ